MPHYYFDIETTGLDSQDDKIITIQYQKIAIDNGIPEEPLTILKSWEKGNSEKKIISEITPLLMSTNPFTFVPVGNNLNFEFNFLAHKIQKYMGIDIDSSYFHSRPSLDLKPVMILLNGGRFKGYNLILKKSTSGFNVPIWFEKNEFKKIISYIENEAKSFTNFYKRIHTLMFNDELRKLTFHSANKEVDNFV